MTLPQLGYSGEVLGSAVDIVLIVLIITFAVNGYRQGFLVGALSFFGFFGGALVGLQIAPLIVRHLGGELSRVVISLGAVFGLAILGQSVAAWAGTRLRRAIPTDGAKRLDDFGGVVVSVLALLIVSWMVAAPLASSPLPGLARSVRHSAILNAVDGVMPDGARNLYAGLRDTIAAGDFPNFFGDLTPTQVQQVAPPDQLGADSPAVRLAQASVVKIIGDAPSCRKTIEGSGFVYAPHHVMTNAHVVAGTRGTLTVVLGNHEFDGTVVAYDPGRDVAVLYVPGLNAPPMTWAGDTASTNDSAVVVGYPLNGPFTAVSARIREMRQVSGKDIYDNATVVRQVYIIRSTVLSGNSGGPLLTPDGQLLGVIFAAAVDDQETGFALTADEAQPIGAAAAGRSNPVSTGNCAA